MIDFANRCGMCGHFGQGAPSLTGAVECRNPNPDYARANRIWVKPLEAPCWAFQTVKELEGKLLRLGLQLDRLTLQSKIVRGEVCGTADDPRIPEEPRARKTKK